MTYEVVGFLLLLVPICGILLFILYDTFIHEPWQAIVFLVILLYVGLATWFLMGAPT